MTEVKGVGTKITQFLDDLRNRRRYWELKKEAEDCKRWKLLLIIGDDILFKNILLYFEETLKGSQEPVR